MVSDGSDDHHSGLGDAGDDHHGGHCDASDDHSGAHDDRSDDHLSSHGNSCVCVCFAGGGACVCVGPAPDIPSSHHPGPLISNGIKVGGGGGDRGEWCIVQMLI